MQTHSKQRGAFGGFSRLIYELGVCSFFKYMCLWRCRVAALRPFRAHVPTEADAFASKIFHSQWFMSDEPPQSGMTINITNVEAPCPGRKELLLQNVPASTVSVKPIVISDYIDADALDGEVGKLAARNDPRFLKPLIRYCLENVNCAVMEAE